MEKHPFTFEGRIGRTTFWFRTFLVIFAMYITVVIAIYMEEPLILIANANIGVILIVFWGMQAVKRVHDIDKPWWYAFIPFYNLFLFNQKGIRGENHFGIDPVSPPINIKVQRRKSIQIPSENQPIKVREVDIRPQIKIKKRG